MAPKNEFGAPSASDMEIDDSITIATEDVNNVKWKDPQGGGGAEDKRRSQVETSVTSSKKSALREDRWKYQLFF